MNLRGDLFVGVADASPVFAFGQPPAPRARWSGPWRWKRHEPPEAPGITFVREYIDTDGHQAFLMHTKVTL